MRATYGLGTQLAFAGSLFEMTVTLHFTSMGSIDDRRQLINRNDVAMVSAPADAAPLPDAFSFPWERSPTAPRQRRD